MRQDKVERSRPAAAVERDSPWRVLDYWRLNGRSRRTITLRHGDCVQQVGVDGAAGGHELAIGSQRWFARGSAGPNGVLLAQLGDRRVSAAVVFADERRHVFFEGRAWPLALVDTLNLSDVGDTAEAGLRAPMPGKVIALVAQTGALVEKGTPLLILEAMKMEHTISAPSKGRVKAFRFAPGDQVSDGVELVEFEAQA
jgi:3-methylcrotonyl-CoA carboxylase alpha subunit